MVIELKEKKKTYYACGICKFVYETRELAQKCEDFCRAYNSCSLEITKHAIRKG